MKTKPSPRIDMIGQTPKPSRQNNATKQNQNEFCAPGMPLPAVVVVEIVRVVIGGVAVLVIEVLEVVVVVLRSPGVVELSTKAYTHVILRC